jgi:hypothetical protein
VHFNPEIQRAQSPPIQAGFDSRPFQFPFIGMTGYSLAGLEHRMLKGFTAPGIIPLILIRCAANLVSISLIHEGAHTGNDLTWLQFTNS